MSTDTRVLTVQAAAAEARRTYDRKRRYLGHVEGQYATYSYCGHVVVVMAGQPVSNTPNFRGR